MFAGYSAFVLMVGDLLAYKYKSPIAGYLEGWLSIIIQIVAVFVLVKYYSRKTSNYQQSNIKIFFVGMAVTIIYSLTWSLTSFIYIQYFYPNYETEMISYLYHPSPFATAAETSGLYLMAQISANAYTNSFFKLITGLFIGIIFSTVNVFLNNRRNKIYRNLTSHSS